MKAVRKLSCLLVLSSIGPLFTGDFAVASNDTPLDTSIIQLIANPEKYHNKLVRTEGYLHNKFEDSGLYLSKEDADHLVGKNALWVTYDVKEAINLLGQIKNPQLHYFDCKMVLLVGTFNKDSNGHRGMFAGELSHVSRVLELTRWYDGPNDLTKAKK